MTGKQETTAKSERHFFDDAEDFAYKTGAYASRPVALKALEWKEIDLRVGKPPLVIWEARTPFMNYSIERIMERPWFCSFLCMHFNDLEVAKMVVQADYEKRIRSALSTSQSDPTPAPKNDPAPEKGSGIPCPCTTFEQDEDCYIGFPSLLCSACDGKGVADIETVTALAAEMLKVAEQVGELEDPFAAWESIELLKSQNDQLRKDLAPIVGNAEAIVITSQRIIEECDE
jgi:hypothetical protein